MEDRKIRRVALFGSSLNPPTGEGGHVGLVRYFSARFDEVWVLPVYRHMFDSKRNLASFDHRTAMAELAFGGIPGVVVSDMERELGLAAAETGESVGTVDVVRTLRLRHPETDFSLIMGGDTYRDLREGKWKGTDELMAAVRFEVTGRTGAVVEATEAPPNVTVHETIDGLCDVSSTMVRSTVGEEALGALVPPTVARYIVENRLYAHATT